MSHHMPPADLRQFISLLEAHGDLVRVTTPVDPVLEIAAVTDRVCKKPGGGQALLFEQPLGSTFPLAANLFGSMERTALALGVASLDELTERLAALIRQIPAPHMTLLDRQIADLPGFAAYAPAAAPPGWTCAMSPPDLTLFPFLHSWPDDGSAAGCPRYITLPQIFTTLPDGSAPNCGMYRCQVRAPRELAIRWSPGSGAARHLEAWRQQGRPMPAAIVLGGAPAALFTAMIPLPGDLDEMTFAGFLQGKPVSLAPCRTVPLRVPAGAEIVIEGTVAPEENVTEGPFGNHTGFYSPAGPAALLRVSAVSYRPGAVVPATVVGAPPMEDCWMAQAWERLLLALLQRLIPGIIDIRFPLEWTFHQSAIISLETPSPGMVRETARQLWQLPWFAGARMTVFTDAGSTPADSPGLAWRCINLAESPDDVFTDDSGMRRALDATGSRYHRHMLVPDPATLELVRRRWQEYGLS